MPHLNILWLSGQHNKSVTTSSTICHIGIKHAKPIINTSIVFTDLQRMLHLMNVILETRRAH